MTIETLKLSSVSVFTGFILWIPIVVLQPSRISLGRYYYNGINVGTLACVQAYLLSHINMCLTII